MSDRPDPPGEDGEEPDPRFTFANERTFLAWNRTALALIAAGAAAAAFLRTGLGGARLIVALPLLALGSAVAATSYGRWRESERAIRLGEAIPQSRAVRVLGWSIAAIALVTAVLAVVDVFVSPSSGPPPPPPSVAPG